MPPFPKGGKRGAGQGIPSGGAQEAEAPARLPPGKKGRGGGQGRERLSRKSRRREGKPYFMASSPATATETVAPTMGLLPMPRKPIISTWAGTELEPANWASECIRPRVSVKP